MLYDKRPRCLCSLLTDTIGSLWRSKKKAAGKKAASRNPAKSIRENAAQSVNAANQLDEFLAKFTPEVTETAKQALRKMRTRLPGAIELIYDNYNALASAPPNALRRTSFRSLFIRAG